MKSNFFLLEIIGEPGLERVGPPLAIAFEIAKNSPGTQSVSCTQRRFPLKSIEITFKIFQSTLNLDL